MGLERGINKPHNEGVYICSNDFLWEFKVFHENSKKPTHLIAREFTTNEKLGPLVIKDVTKEEIEKSIEAKSKHLHSKLASK